MEARDGLVSVSLGSTKDIGLRLVAEGRFKNLSETCRAGLRRLAEDARVIDWLAALGDEGMASGADDTFDIDIFVDDGRAGGWCLPGRTSPAKNGLHCHSRIASLQGPLAEAIQGDAAQAFTRPWIATPPSGGSR